jgi:hypothetical protein
MPDAIHKGMKGCLYARRVGLCAVAREEPERILLTSLPMRTIKVEEVRRLCPIKGGGLTSRQPLFMPGRP